MKYALRNSIPRTVHGLGWSARFLNSASRKIGVIEVCKLRNSGPPTNGINFWAIEFWIEPGPASSPMSRCSSNNSSILILLSQCHANCRRWFGKI